MIKKRTNKKRMKRRTRRNSRRTIRRKDKWCSGNDVLIQFVHFQEELIDFDACVLVKVYDIHDEKEPLNVADVNVTPPYDPPAYTYFGYANGTAITTF